MKKLLLYFCIILSINSFAQTAVRLSGGSGGGGNYLSSTLANGTIYLGNGSNVATSVTPSGDWTMTNAGVSTVTKINNVSLAGLATGILKNTTGTGVPSIAVAGDFPTLNQNTSGSAGSVTNSLTISSELGNTTYNGSVSRTIAIQAASVTNAMLAGSIDLTTKVTGILPGTNGGTGVNNGVKTLTLSGNTIIGSTTNTVTLGTTGNTSVTLPTSGTLATTSGTETFTNKRWVARVGSTTSSATPAINTDSYDIFKITALATNINTMTTSLSGSPNDGDILEIQITDDGSTRTITWGSSFVSSSVTLPTSTTASTTMTVVLQYYTVSSYGNTKWVCAKVF
jgi:hypothetical protein